MKNQNDIFSFFICYATTRAFCPMAMLFSAIPVVYSETPWHNFSIVRVNGFL